MKAKSLFAAACLAGGLAASPGSSAPIAAVGTTDVTVAGDVLAFLTAAGIAATPIAPATASGATFSFPITGGDTDTLTIAHSGGVDFRAGASFVSASNFLISGAGGTVSATVDGSIALFDDGPLSDVAIFDLANVDLGGPITADLLINDTLNTVFSATFADGANLGLTGGTFGSAVTAPQPVPLPASALLLLAGMGGLAAMRRRAAA